MSADCVWLIGLFEHADVLFGQLHIERANGALQMLDFGGADYWSRYTRPLQQPGESDFRRSNTELFRDFASRFDDLQI